jgi:hypothetical protein
MHEYVGRDQTCGLQKLQVAPLTVPLFLEGRPLDGRTQLDLAAALDQLAAVYWRAGFPARR